MSNIQSVGAGSELDKQAEVSDYLRRHPDFFIHQADLLGELSLPHDSGGAVSLVERQVGVLREQVGGLRQRMAELIDTARENQELHRQLHQLTLEMIMADDTGALLDLLYRRLAEDFSADRVTSRLFAEPTADDETARVEWVGSGGPGQALFERVLRDGKPICGRLAGEQLSFLFGEQDASIGSVALIPLRRTEPLGLLAIASHDAERFHPGMATDLLQQLAQVVSVLLEPRLKPGHVT